MLTSERHLKPALPRLLPYPKVLVGKAKGTKWLAITKDGKDLGFVYGRVLAAVLDGKLSSSIKGKLVSSGQPKCDYIINFDAKHKVKGNLQVTSDYWVAFTCMIRSKRVEFLAAMFITELPYLEHKKNIFQINVDLPSVADNGGEVMSITTLYYLNKRKLLLDNISVPSMANKVSSSSKPVNTVPEVLKAALDLSYRLWGRQVWESLESRRSLQ